MGGIDITFIDEVPDHILSSVPSGDGQRGASLVVGLVRIRAKFLVQTSYGSLVASLGRQI